MMTSRLLALVLLLLAAASPLAAYSQDAAKQTLNDQFYEAVRKGDPVAVKTLLDKGADVNAKFRYGATALFKAAERGHTEIVKLLLDKGADVSVKDTFYGATAMTWALNNNHVEVVRALLAKGGGTVDEVLMTGAREGNTEMIRVALDKGGATPTTLTSALVAATEAGKPDLVELLKKAGAQPPFEVDAATLATYAGKYKPEQGGDITITLADGKLSATPTGQRTFALLAVDRTTFRPVAFDGIVVTFIVEGDKVTGLSVKQGPNTTAYKKQE